MARFDRYMLSQLMVTFGFFSLVLVLIYWINAAVRLFDQLIADGQGAAIIIELIVLSLPNVIRLALPISAFAASVYVTNRLSQDSELVVMQATGYSPWRLARPVLYFGLIVAVLISVLMHLLVPLSTTALNQRQAEIAQNITARILTEGQFIEPTDGITVYIRAITPEGELQDVFLSDMRDPATQISYTARRAYLVRGDNDTQLVMVNGMAQSLRTEDQRLFVTDFADFSYNIGKLIRITPRDSRSSREVMTWNLLQPTPALEAETGRSAAQLITEAHDRISQGFLGTIAAMLGFAALMIGSFSRFGVWPQVVFAIVLIIFIKGIETTGLDLARTSPQMWFATYLAVGIGFSVIAALLFVAARPYLFKRKPARVVS